MTMAKQKIDSVYIAEGLAEDCEELILKCSQVAKLSFEKFSRIWKEMEFATIYYGRPSGAELAEFSEEALHIAKFFMVSNINNNFEKSVAGLFLVYGILNLQPYPRFAPLRLVQDDLVAIQKLEFVARRERRHDILYILGEVLIRGPCQFHVSPRERGLDFCIRKYYDGCTQHAIIGQKPIGVFHRHNEELDIIRELTYLEDHYENAKQKITGALQDRSLHYANAKLAKDLQSTLKTVVSGIVVQDKQPDVCKDKAIGHHDAVKAIKDKAMKIAVDPIKHLTGVDDRNKTPETSTKKKTKKSKEYMKLLCKKRKKTSESPESPMKSPKPNYPWSLKLFNKFEEEETSPPKHKPYKSAVRTSPRQQKPSTSESPTQPGSGLMEIDIEPLEASKNDVNLTKSPKTPTKRNPRKKTPKRVRPDRKPSVDTSSDEEPVAKKTAQKRAKAKSKTNSTENAFTAITNKESQLVELTIDKLPIELNAENKNIEIEIIDLYKGKGDKKTIKFENGRKVEMKSLPKVNNNWDDAMQNEPSTSNAYKKMGHLRKNMKLTKLKSRIKRLGVDEVVDFESGDSSD